MDVGNLDDEEGFCIGYEDRLSGLEKDEDSVEDSLSLRIWGRSPSKALRDGEMGDLFWSGRMMLIFCRAPVLPRGTRKSLDRPFALLPEAPPVVLPGAYIWPSPAGEAGSDKTRLLGDAGIDPMLARPGDRSELWAKRDILVGCPPEWGGESLLSDEDGSGEEMPMAVGSDGLEEDAKEGPCELVLAEMRGRSGLLMASNEGGVDWTTEGIVVEGPANPSRRPEGGGPSIVGLA